MFIILFVVFLSSFHDAICRPQGFHFNRFSGPVSGPITRVEVPNNGHNGAPGHGTAVDYVAKPDYSFAYGVEDPLSGNYQNQKEIRDGDVVKGEYSLVDADGVTRRVTYTADSRNGFQATVHTSEPNSEHAIQQHRFASNLPKQPQYQQQQQQQPQQQYNDGRYDDDY